MNVPILGRARLNQDAIKLVERVLERLKKGELLNVAIVAEQLDGQMFTSFVVDAAGAVKMRGALGLQATQLDLKMIGQSR